MVRFETGKSNAIGQPACSDPVFVEMYATLRDLARRYLTAERRHHTLQPTALVHEAYLTLRRSDSDLGRDRGYFYASAARAMRQILVDHARRRLAEKRGGGWNRVGLEKVLRLGAPVDILELNDALTQLARQHERSARVAELRLFAELTHDEIAELLDVSRRTVDFDWRFARASLSTELETSR